MATKTKKSRIFPILLVIILIILTVYAFGFRVPKRIKTQLSTKEAEINSLTSEIGDLKGEKEALQVKADSLVCLKTQINNLPENPCAERDAVIVVLQNQIVDLQNQIADKDKEIIGLWGGIGARDKTITKLENEKAELEIQILNFRTKIEILSQVPIEDKVEILIGRNQTTVNFELADGDCFLNTKTGETFTLNEAKKKGEFYIYLLENHYEKIEGTLNGNLLTFHIPNYEYTKFCIFVGKKSGKKEELWELTESGGGSKFLYINGDQYCYYFQNDNRIAVSLGNQSG